jgi:hypothetical protein
LGLVCKPKNQGGSGVIKLTTQNDCLFMKHLRKIFNRSNLPRVNMVWEFYYSIALPPAKARDISFWWRDCLKSLPEYKRLASCTVLNGSSVMLWQDSWHDGPLKWQLSHLFSFAKNEAISIASAVSMDSLWDHFHLPLSTDTYA